MYTMPILLIGFNRPQATNELIDILRNLRPAKLYCFVDKERVAIPEEEKVNQVKQIVEENIDWDCEKKYYYPEKNLNCRYGPEAAISWFFENEEMGIILEDDIRPDLSFFPYMETLLNYYKKDERVGLVSGRNDRGIYDIGYSYNFSAVGSIWGWGTWRRSWKDFKKYEQLWNSKEIRNLVSDRLQKIGLGLTIVNKMDKVMNNEIITWDYIWAYVNLAMGRMAVFPKINLVENVGFGPDATHTKESRTDRLEAYKIESKIVHTPHMAIDLRYYENSKKNSNRIRERIIARIRKYF